jgi:iron complex outermembrane receptor protein
VLNLKNTLLIGASVTAFAVIAAPALAQNASGDETVVVTGTRVQGMTAADSAAPITVLGSDTLTQGAGSADLRQALGQTVPSFNVESVGGDLANLTLSAALRGLSPNATLVMVNGKRRHGTGNLHVLGGAFGGSAAPDISLIPTAAIDHIEVLTDGAAAQYGTDAIAGVVNIILKKKSSGGKAEFVSGQNYSNEGQSYDMSFNMGMPLFDKGFVNVTVDKKYHNFTQNGGPDNRLIDANGNVVSEGFVGNAAIQAAPTGSAFGQVSASNKATAANQAAAGIVPCTGGVCIPLSQRQNIPGYPRVNHISGDAEFQLTTAMVNAGYDISDNVQFYTFGSYGHRFAKANENDRLPTQVIAAPGSNQPCSATNLQGYNTAVTANGVTPACAIGVSNGFSGTGVTALGNNGLNSAGQVISSGQAGTLYTPGELVFAPQGFNPQEVLKEDDYQYNAGLKFNLAGWDVDANLGYGKDIDNIYTWNSGNRSLFIDTHTSPTTFYDGTFTATEFIGTLDASHPFNVGLASPLNVAVGVEAREDTYQIRQGDFASSYKEGAQSFPGFAATDAGTHSRKNYAGYIDLAVAPIPELQLDVAGRFEHYTDFGDAKIGKITARYDITPQLALRGTISTGFRAPTLAEEFYSATNVTPTAGTVQLPANSASAKVLGIENLTPENSTQYSVGIVAHPLDDLSVTLDAYSIALGNRIVRTDTIYGLGGAINSSLVNDAIRAHGNQIDPTVVQTGVTAFINGINSLTQGVDLTVNYPTDFGQYGLVDWTLAGNYTQTSVSGVAPVPQVLANSAPGISLFSFSGLYALAHRAPQEKINLSANWSLDEFGITLRETYYGPVHGFGTPNGGAPFYTENQAAVGITDLEARYNVTDQLQFAIGGNNLFNIRPNTAPFVTNTPSASSGAAQLVNTGSNINRNYIGSAYNPNGGYYYGRITFNF